MVSFRCQGVIALSYVSMKSTADSPSCLVWIGCNLFSQNPVEFACNTMYMLEVQSQNLFSQSGFVKHQADYLSKEISCSFFSFAFRSPACIPSFDIMVWKDFCHQCSFRVQDVYDC